jgi:hypothetical protein
MYFLKSYSVSVLWHKRMPLLTITSVSVNVLSRAFITMYIFYFSIKNDTHEACRWKLSDPNATAFLALSI